MNLFDLSRPVVKPVLVNETIMAVDFGQKGGFAWNDGAHLLTAPMMGYEKDIADFLKRTQPKTLYGEDVHPFPGQGVVSIGTLMEGKGVIRGICATLGIGLELIQPTEWIRWYDIGKRADFVDSKGKKDITLWKKHLQAYAQKLFPSADIPLKVADAVLIWNFALNPQRIRKIRPFT